MLSEEEFDLIVRETKVSSLSVNHEDPLRDLMEEIYWEGYCDGYRHAIGILQRTGPSIFGSNADTFFKRNMSKIHKRVEAIGKKSISTKAEDTLSYADKRIIETNSQETER